MIEVLEGVKVEQVNIEGVPEKDNHCPDCGRLKLSNRPCRGNKLNQIYKIYAKACFDGVQD